MAMLFILNICAFAEGTEEAKATADIDFVVTEVEDIVELDLSVRNAKFMGFQMALRYNKDVLVPVDEAGEATDDFRTFAKLTEEAKFFSTIGNSVTPDQGIFGFTVYIMPGTKADGLNEKYEYVADENGLDIYKFRFKKIADGDYGFELATEDETKPYQKGLSDGLTILDYEGSPETTVTFKLEGKEDTVTTVAPYKPAPAPEMPKPITDEERKQDVICLQVGKSLSIAYGKKALIDPENDKVVPYITEDRTMVPLRFIAENLGAEVIWTEGENGCTIKKDDKEIKITFDSAEFVVNGEKITYDAPIQVVQDRTMVPVRFISEQFGCDVYWNDLNKAVVIAPLDNPWIATRSAEIMALNEMLVTMLGIF